MSNWRSKSSNKKSDNKQSSKMMKTDYSLPKEKDTINSINTVITIENDETCSLLKNRKETSIIKDSNIPALRQLRNCFCFGSSMIEKQEAQHVPNAMTFETSMGWEQILDREFQSLDIDADGYVSIADLQSVLK